MNSIAGLGRLLLVLGLVLALAGVGLIVVGRLGLSRLPGDIVVERRGFSLYVPLASALLVSLILSLIINLLLRR
jgi:hypothetical protein